MLRRRPAQQGLTLIELMTVLTILAVALLMGAPSFSSWLKNSRLRSSAESILAGIQFAKAEAVSRNALVRFQLTTTLDNACAISTTGSNWVVNLVGTNDNVNGKCNAQASDWVSAADAAAVQPFIIKKHEPLAGNGAVTVNSGASTLVFNGLGRVTPLPAGDIQINVTPSSGTCAASGGTMTCLRIVVSPQGQVRMCDPNLSSRNPRDPQGC